MKEIKGSSALPPNVIWDKGKAPVERLEGLKTMVEKTRKDVFVSMHKQKISPEEISATLKQIQNFQNELKETRPKFPELKLPDCHHMTAPTTKTSKARAPTPATVVRTLFMITALRIV